MGAIADALNDPPWGPDGLSHEVGELHSIDGVEAGQFVEDDVAEVLYHGADEDRWDGSEAVVVRLHDGRLAAWETWWGPTGSGFWADAYGGGEDIWFSGPDGLKTLVLQALTDHGRELCGIPREGL